MRVAVVDYAGHPFQVQLSRELARRGNDVLHLYFSEIQGPRGKMLVAADDAASLEIEPASLGVPFEKDTMFKRRWQEIEVGRMFARRIAEFGPDAVLASNVPLDALNLVSKRCLEMGWAFVLWEQDLISVAIERILRRKLGVLGTAIGHHYRAVESRIVKRSKAIVAISQDFVPCLTEHFGANAEHIQVIENWAPLDEIAVCPKDNCWSREHGVSGKTVVLYSGTLGMKHNPSLILCAAEKLKARGDAVILVVSEGPAADRIACRAAEENLPIRVLGFQPFDCYSEVLGSADVLISILESDAGAFSVPSKVLSYLCAERPIVLCAPKANLAARTVLSAGAGKVVAAGDGPGFAGAIEALLDNPDERLACGRNGRRFAERTFDIATIADKFEGVLVEALRRAGRTAERGPRLPAFVPSSAEARDVAPAAH